ncbi:pilus assembly protein [Aliihoeflea aestuarii]|jgi:Flp pilus assembly protein TadG|uniref:TadE/TadG family type IV pilus assembly protein n=1 Tax=Aliihoeflea aestuarii TaxID=453840 RepID=UPI0020928362|nr:TadE/TadG family type IV pilus assembly protein [Aliihoeflea aestuarii]MCO6391471.1 pilus assembly protein [Aliihoeflea aestuarii]
MSSSTSRTRRRFGRPLLRRFLRRRDGSTAIEFSILVIPFVLLVFAILESCISFAAQQIMTNAADDVARLYRTGQERSPSDPNQSAAEAVRLRAMVCDKMQILVSAGCPGLSVDLRTFNSFASVSSIDTPIKDGDLDTGQFGAMAGGAGSKNMLRVYYKWPIITDLMRLSMSNLSGGKVLHFAMVTWQNEPYPD